MAERRVKIWHDSEGDFLEVIFDSKPGHFRETSNDHVMEKVDDEGNILGFSVLKVSALKRHWRSRCSVARRWSRAGCSSSGSSGKF